MKSRLFIIAFIIFWMSIVHAQAEIRCNNDIIAIDDTTSEVKLKVAKCGEILDKETVRKETVEGSGDKHQYEKYIERWLVRVDERGGKYCYPLTFERGILKNIGKWHKCD